MIYVLVSIVFFIFTFAVHLFIHRFLIGRGTYTIWVFSVYGAGFIVNAVVMLIIWQMQVGDQRGGPLPKVGIFLFGLLVADIILFSMTPFLGDESPTSKIALSVENSGKMSKSGFVSLMSQKLLIDRRLDDMVSAGWITKKNNKYQVTAKGKRIASVYHWYRKVLGAGDG